MKQFFKTLVAGIVAITGMLAAQTAQAAPFAAFVMDARTGQEIYSQNGDARLHPASLTKMMTLYMAFNAIERGQVRLDSRFTVSSNAAAQPPSRLGLRPGQQIELRYLIRAAAVKSANDAATTICEGLGGGSQAQGVANMNALARAIGMRNSHFMNCNGLSVEGHYSTARDMSTLGRRLFYDFPQYYPIFSRRSADAGIATVSSTNKNFLDNYPGADGIKTGYTRAAGFNLTASAHRGNKRIIATVFGGTSTAQRNAVISQLLDAGFSRSPSFAQEIRPAAPVIAQQPVVRTASEEPQPGQPAPVRARASTAAIISGARPVQQPDATPKKTAKAAPKSADAPVATASVESSGRPSRRPGAAKTAAASGTDDAVAAAMNDDTPARPSAKSTGGTNRPTAAPPKRSAKNADASDVISPSPASAGSTFAVAMTSEKPPFPEEGDRGDDGVAPLRSSAPTPRKDAVILASLQADDATTSPVATEIVTRSKSGGRGYGIVIGRYRSKSEAESRLLKLALQESDVLGSARRSICDTAKGFEAGFAGMSKDAASLMCEKLSARTMPCTVIGGK